MKKIRRFSLNENSVLLSAEQMQMLTGGALSSVCKVGACYVIWAYPEVRYEYGICAEQFGECYCHVPSGVGYRLRKEFPKTCVAQS